MKIHDNWIDLLSELARCGNQVLGTKIYISINQRTTFAKKVNKRVVFLSYNWADWMKLLQKSKFSGRK